MSYRRVLLPLDLSAEHDAVFEAAAQQVVPHDGVVLLLHVIEAVAGFTGDEAEEFYAPLHARADRLLAEWSSKLEASGLAVDPEIRTGKRGPAVVQYAVEQRCDLIILRSHAPDPERERWGLGTTSHQVALMAPCSVLLVR